MNKVVLIGRLTRDPELRYLPNGVSVTTFTIAVDRNFTNQQGERGADFIPIVVWRALAENCHKFLGKGRLVAVSGRIQTRNYDAQDGTKRYVTEVVADDVRFLDRGNNDAPRSQDPASDYQRGGFASEPTDPTGFHSVEGDDDLPF